MSRVKFLWASEEFAKHGDKYWSRVLDISTQNTLERIRRCTQIMGRQHEKSLSASQIFYPCMQCADIFFLGVDVCQLGMDQRKVNMLAREYAEKRSLPKPVILSHPMMPGLKKGQEKMSKSIPDTAIFMEDPAEEVERKIRGAFCPDGSQLETDIEKILLDRKEGDAEDDPTLVKLQAETTANPILAYFRMVVADSLPEGEPLMVGDFRFNNYQELRAAFVKDEITPQLLKQSLVKYLNALIQPVRNHFENNSDARVLKEKVLSYATSR